METNDFDDFKVWRQKENEKETGYILLIALVMVLGIIIMVSINVGGSEPASVVTTIPATPNSTAVLVLNIDGTAVWRDVECDDAANATAGNTACERKEHWRTMRVARVTDLGEPPTVLLYTFRCGAGGVDLCTVDGADVWQCDYAKAAAANARMSDEHYFHCMPGFAGKAHWVVTERAKIPGGEALRLSRSHL